MMKLSATIALAVLSLAGSTVAAAVARTDAHAEQLGKRNIGGVFICPDVNWGGQCGYAVQALDKCIVLGSDWADKISSFGPDQCTTCTAYGTKNCAVIPGPGNPGPLPIWQFSFPGDSTGGIGTANPWNDRIESFICTKSC